MANIEKHSSIAKLVAVIFQVGGYGFLLLFVPRIKSVLSVPEILVFALIYLSGVRSISKWLQSAISRRAA